MIVGLIGTIIKKSENHIHINVNSVIYQVFVSKNTIASLPLNEQITLDILQIIKEESNTLYGFIDKNEQIIFQKTIKINGIGAKIALEICSHFTPKSFYSMIQNSDIKSLQKVPGIGAKSAGKILVELNAFSIDILEHQHNDMPFYSDAIGALENLGFNKKDIHPVLDSCKDAKNAQELVKEALKKLGKNKGKK